MGIENRILIAIGNAEISRTIMEQLIIEGGYGVSIEQNADDAAGLFKESSFDAVIAEFGQPDNGGIKVLQKLRSADPDCVIIAYLENPSPEMVEETRGLGVYDVVSRPFNWEHLFFAVRKAAELHNVFSAQRKFSAIQKEQFSALQKQNILLAKRIEESTRNLARLYEDLRSTYLRTIRALAQAIDARDHYTHDHSENVGKYSVAVAQEMGLTIKEIESIREASELHDLGKIGISDTILLKPGSLTAEEWEQIKRHPQTGAQILEPLTFLGDVIELVRQHHEHFNGSGYPDGKKGEEILLGARILHLADAYEAMTSARSYRKTPLSKEQAIAEIQKNSGTQFDPKVIEVFLKVIAQE
jgi:response regulator RpfG family c-di-GMP phosphodiesterase